MRCRETARYRQGGLIPLLCQRVFNLDFARQTCPLLSLRHLHYSVQVQAHPAQYLVLHQIRGQAGNPETSDRDILQRVGILALVHIENNRRLAREQGIVTFCPRDRKRGVATSRPESKP